MKLLNCRCGQSVFCDNMLCVHCGRSLGFDAFSNTMHSLDPLGDGRYSNEAGEIFRLCNNREQYEVCNGLVPESNGGPEGSESTPEPNGDTGNLCRCCSLNRALPNLQRIENILLWSRLERAKRRLISGLTHLELSPYAPTSRGWEQMKFEFLEDKRSHSDALESFVSTGHKDGVITINVLEADDVQRVQQQQIMGERYRTVLGHFRHEAGHFYYQRLIGDGEEFKKLFGDPLDSYEDALARYYDKGPPMDWDAHWISAYASSHPLEDWAECFAHYLHINDCLETAYSHGMAPSTVEMEMDWRLTVWNELAISINEISRSLGVRDAYPFSISSGVRQKLEFVGRCIAAN